MSKFEISTSLRFIKLQRALGTASNNPTPVRGVSATCFRYEGEVWLIDAGEGTQTQFMKSSVKPGKITKIFVTHLHGDHIFGLPGLMCTIGQNIVENKRLEIYGPVGLRRFLRTSLELSRSMVTYSYIVHELVPIDEQTPEDIKKWKITETEDSYLHPSEVLGRQIIINKNGYWDLFETDQVSVKAGWIRHRVATFGFVIEQKPQPGSLDVDALKAVGVQPGPIYKKIKAGENVTLDNGTILEASRYVGPARVGKKVTLLGDCYAVPEQTIQLAKNSDLLVHESTLENAFKEKAISNGHSSPSMAAEVANKINAKCLILSHFSQRYKPLNYFIEKNIDPTKLDPNEEEIEWVQKLVDEAKLNFNGNCMAAYDFFSYKP